MTTDDLQRELQYRGSDLHRLMAWLQQPRQGILPQIAMPVITEICQELKDGKKWYMESLMYPEGLRKAIAKGMLPETYWVEMYVLERCRWAQEDLLTGVGLAVEPIRIEKALQDLARGIVHLEAMIVPIKKFLSIPDYMKRAWARLKRELDRSFDWSWE